MVHGKICFCELNVWSFLDVFYAYRQNNIFTIILKWTGIQKQTMNFQNPMQKINQNIFQFEMICEVLFIQEKKPELNTQSDLIKAKTI